MNIKKIYLLCAFSSCLVVNYSYSSDVSPAEAAAPVITSIERAILDIAAALRKTISINDINTIKSRLFEIHGHAPTQFQETAVIPLTIDYLTANR
jgi:hypothetical protein